MEKNQKKKPLPKPYQLILTEMMRKVPEIWYQQIFLELFVSFKEENCWCHLQIKNTLNPCFEHVVNSYITNLRKLLKEYFSL